MRTISLILSIILAASIVNTKNNISDRQKINSIAFCNNSTYLNQTRVRDSDSTTGTNNLLNYRDLKSAVKAIGSDKITLTISAPTNVKSSLTIPQNITLNFTDDGALYIDTKSSVTIEGWIEAPLRQIFYGGKVMLGVTSDSLVYPEWWGAGILRSSIINREAINNAELSLSKRKSGTVYFSGDSSDTYKIDSTLLCYSGIFWDGYAVIKQDTGVSVPLIKINGDSNITFRNLIFDGNSTGRKIPSASMINISGLVKHVYFQNIKFNYFKYSAVTIHGTGNDILRSDSTQDIIFDKCVFNYDPGVNNIALYVAGVEKLIVKDCTFFNVQFSAIELAGGYNKYAQIINNKFYMGKLGYWCVEAMGAVEHAVISYNQSVCGLSGGGISAHLRYTTITNNHIINGITGSDRSGTEISGSNNFISENTIDNGTLAVISDGTVAYTVEYSRIRSSYDTLFCHDNIISNNFVKNRSGGAGISIYFDPSVFPPYDTISNILIYKNSVIETNLKGASPRAYYLGMHRSKLSNIVLSNNIALSDSNKFIKNGTAFFISAPYGSHNIRIMNDTAINYQYGFFIDTAYYYNVLVENNDLGRCSVSIASARRPYLFNSIGNNISSFNGGNSNNNNNLSANSNFVPIFRNTQIDSIRYSVADTTFKIYSNEQIFTIKGSDFSAFGFLILGLSLPIFYEMNKIRKKRLKGPDRF